MLSLLQCLTVFPDQVHDGGMSTATLVPIKSTPRQSPSGSYGRGASHLSSPGKCERLYAFRHVHKISPKFSPDYMLLGTLVHTHLAYHYQDVIQKTGQGIDLNPEWYSTPKDKALAYDASGRPDLIEESNMIYEAYADWYSADYWRPLAAEFEFVATVKELDPDGSGPEDGMEIVAKVDLFYEENGENYICDHKTKQPRWGSQRLPEWSDEDFLLSWQVLLYTRIVRVHCRREGIKPPKGFSIQRVLRSLPFDSDRHVLRIPGEAYAQTPRTARMLARREYDLLKRLDKGEPVVPNFSACGGFFGCDYQSLCAAGPLERQQLLKTMYVRNQ